MFPFVFHKFSGVFPIPLINQLVGFLPFSTGGQLVFIATPIVYNYFSPAISICMFCKKFTEFV